MHDVQIKKLLFQGAFLPDHIFKIYNM